MDIITGLTIGLFGGIMWLWGYSIFDFTRRNRGRAKFEAAEAQYRRILVEYLRPGRTLPSFRFPGIEESQIHDRSQIQMTARLSGVVTGLENRLLLLAFRSNALYVDLIRICKKRNKEWQCRALSIYSTVQVQRNTLYELGHLLYSRNRNVRMFALMARIKAHPERMMLILKNYTFPLSPRAWANIHGLIVRDGIPVDNLGLLLRSKNRSVALLGLRLIGLFSVAGYEDEIETLLFETSAARRKGGKAPAKERVNISVVV